MAKVSGLFGVPRGKLAQLVFATWKGIGYARLYVIPGNPQTEAQTTNRTNFKVAVKFAKAILGSVLQPFSDPFVKGQSAFSKCVGLCMDAWHDGVDFLLVKPISGTLESTNILTAVYAGSNVTVTWSATCQGNGQATDKACVFVYDSVHQVSFFSSSAARSAATVAVNVGAGRSEAFLTAYLFFADSATAPTVVSNTDPAQVTV